MIILSTSILIIRQLQTWKVNIRL